MRLLIAWLLVLIAMLATLFAEYVLHWAVCPLCWYQRICIYPLVILLGIAAFKNERVAMPYIIPLPILGFLFALYQYLEQMVPGFSPIDFCTQGVSCATIHFKWLGFITLPFLSGILCLFVIGLCVWE